MKKFLDRQTVGLIIVWIILTFCFTPVYAALNLTLTQGASSALPIAVVPFGADDDHLADIITQDLTCSGKFKVFDKALLPAQPVSSVQVKAYQWQALKQNNLLVGSVAPEGLNKYRIRFQLLDVYHISNNQSLLLDQTLLVSKNEMRQAAHHISDKVYQALTGVRGVFSTRIAYISVKRYSDRPVQYALEVADYDGANPKPLLISSQPVMSPAWSHDGKKIAYVSFENKQPRIYISDVSTGARTLITNYPGINGAPAWSRDDRQLAAALSKTDSPKIYLIHLTSKQLNQLTSGSAIDTEPAFAPDGQSLLFTSDRGGSPQIYRVFLNNRQVQRISFNGNYNARSSFSPDGAQIVMIHRGSDTQGYGIGLQDLQSGAYLTLDNGGDDQSPSFSPNGQMIIFAAKAGGQRQLALVSVDGRVKLRLPADQGDVQEPVWSPFYG